MLNYLLIFIVFGFIGWVIDTSYRSITLRKYYSGTLIPLFSPIYGFGALVLVLLFTYLQAHIIVQIIAAGLLLTILELLGGIYCVKILRRKLWDYSKNKWNYKGYIDALHSFYWLILAFIFRIVIFPYLPI
jgi:uncharacterized membrane protein